MRKTRSVAYQLAMDDFLEVLQKGKVIGKNKLSKDEVRGPIRLRLLACATDERKQKTSYGDDVG